MASIADLEDIWDLPADIVTAPRTSEPLFLDSGSDDEQQPARKKQPASTAAARPDVDALFDNLDGPDDGFGDLPPSLDLEALRREADARNIREARAAFAVDTGIGTQTQGGSASQKKGKGAKKGGKDVLVDDEDEDGEDRPMKKRKPLPKMDEARLLGKDGFPQLIQDTKYFTPKGKGYEAVDLDRVLQIYQFWTHKMYPKTKFRDTVERVEKLCHSKRMHVALSVWRDEAKGLINGRSFPDADDEVVDLTGNDNDNDSAGSDDDGPPRAKKPAGAVIDLDSDAEDSALRPPAPPASSSPTSGLEDDFDLDALLAEEERLKNSAQAMRPSATTSKPAAHGFTDEDEAMWDQMELEYEDAPPPVPKPAAPKPVQHSADDDEDMWDVVREMEEEMEKAGGQTGSTGQASGSAGGSGAGNAGNAGSAPSAQEPRKETNDEGWDDMYL
ncbi:Swi3-domain-containing protein [Dentipellis sp. KUC8613]|nr:Swi3-domain-containing protein [Dentipellis sp. KUC8613]